MKPKIDINSFAVKIVNCFYNVALEIEQTVEKAVIPIYHIPKSKAHQKQKYKPEQFGTGVLVNIKTEYFIFSATHVFDEFDGYVVLVGAGKNKPIEKLTGERYSSGNLESNKVDSNDATVFHIQSKLSNELKRIATTLDYFDIDGFDSSLPVFMIVGFLAKDSNTSGNQAKSKRKAFPTNEIVNYEEYEYDKERHILLAYGNKKLVNNQWQLSPTPRGMSGGAIIKAQGTSLKTGRNKKSQKQLLTAIIIEQHKDKGDKLGFVLGTRVIVHLGLIYQFMPQVLEDYFKK